LPAILPIGQSGAHKITVIAGVRTNGISATKEKYPFVQNYETNAYLSENDTAEVTPTTMYYPNLSFWIEDFEDPTSVELTETIYSKAHLANSSNTDYLKYGAFFGLVQLNATDSIWEANTTGQLSIPLGKEVFLEVDYYLTTNVTTGLTAYNISAQTETPHPYIQLNAEQSSTVVWKKIYIDLHEISDYESTANYFELAFSSILAVNLKSDAVICIDNIKVIHN
jgi:hypothetical protein